jgi:serine/threonine protein phosphatase PrpC
MGIGTSVGAVRDGNQDGALILRASYAATPERDFALGVLCDGIGGLPRGEDAAFWAVSAFVSRFLRTAKLGTPERLAGAASGANAAVYELLRGRGGATLSAIVVDALGTLYGVNVGDSRIYGITQSRALTQLSHDDTLRAILGKQDDVDQSNRLIQYIGMGEGLEPHLITPGRGDFDSILLTSDGVHGAPADVIALVVRNASGNIELVRRLIGLSDILGGHDNSTALILPVRLQRPDSSPEQGLSLTFWSPLDRLEVWLPVLVGDTHQDRPSSAKNESSTNLDSLPTKVRGRRRRPQRKAVDRPIHKEPASSEARREQPIADSERPALDIRFPGKAED